MITVETSFSSLDMPMKYDHGNRRSRGDMGWAEGGREYRGVGVRIPRAIVQRA